jgi:hypothetical protein
MMTEQKSISTLQNLTCRQELDRERLEEVQNATIHLAELLDNLPERERRHMAPLLLLMAERASLPKKNKDQDHKASIKSHALLSVVARSYVD